MPYIPLCDIYYKTELDWEYEYQQRYNNIFTKKLGLHIKEYNRTKEYEAFYCHNEDVMNLQNNIMFNFLKLQKLLNKIPGAGIQQFMKSCLIEEIQSSNEIEGVRSTRKEIQEAISAQITSNKSVRLWGIINKYLKIMNDEEIDLITPSDIRYLYNDFILDEILKDKPENEPDGILFRKNSVDVVTETDKIIHRGLYPENKIISFMEQSLQILHDINIPIFIRISVFHYLFGYIHPFYDGNGRMSRFITSYFLSKTLHPTVALRLSVLIKKHKKEYYKLFEKTNSQNNAGDLTTFIIWSLKLINLSVTNTTDILYEKRKKFIELKTKLESIDFEFLSSDKTSKRIYNILLQAAIFSDIGATTQEIVDTLNISKRTVDSKIKDIPEQILYIDKTSRPYHYKLKTFFLENYK